MNHEHVGQVANVGRLPRVLVAVLVEHDGRLMIQSGSAEKRWSLPMGEPVHGVTWEATALAAVKRETDMDAQIVRGHLLSGPQVIEVMEPDHTLYLAVRATVAEVDGCDLVNYTMLSHKTIREYAEAFDHATLVIMRRFGWFYP